MIVNNKQAKANNKPPMFIKVNSTVIDTFTTTILFSVTPSYGV